MMNRFLSLFVFVLFAFAGVIQSSAAHADNGQKIVDKIAGFAHRAIYNLDEEQLEHVLESYLDEHLNVKALTVTESIDQDVILTYFRKDGQAVFNQPIPDELLNIKSFSAKAMFNGTQIGTILIYYLDTVAIDLTPEEQAWITDHPIIRIGVDTAYPPFEFVDGQGHHQGIAPEYLKLMEKRLGLEFKVVPGLTWQQVLDGVKNQTVDMVPVVTDMTERREYLNFTPAYLPTSMVIFTRTDFPAIRNLADLAGKRLAYPAGYSEISSIRKNHPTIEIIEVQSLLEAIKAVASGRADATQGNLMVIGYLLQENNIDNLKVVAPSETKDLGLSMGVRKDWPQFIPILEKALASITREERQAIRNNWVSTSLLVPDTPLVDLSPEERQWLDKQGGFDLGIDLNWAPFEFVDEDGVYSGIGSSYVDLVRSRLGVTMTPRTDLTWSEALENIKLGKIDIIPTLSRTPEREKFLNFSKPYISFPMVIATRKDFPFIDGLDGLDGKKVGVVKDYVTQELIQTNHKNVQAVLVKSLADGLRQLNEGTIDAFVDNLLTITHEIDQSQLYDLKIASPTQYKFELSMGVRKDLPELIPLINKALDSIDKQKRASIVNSWTSIQVNFGIDLKTILMWVVPAGSVILFIIIFVVRTNRRIEKQSQLLEAVLGSINQGLVAYDNDLKLIISNKQFQDIRGVPEYLTRPGASFDDWVKFDAARGEFDDDGQEASINDLISRAKQFDEHSFERTRPNGTIIDVNGGPLPMGGFVSTFTDITERKLAENKLQDAFEVISSSIQYASRIQRSILPKKEILENNFLEYFTLWEPRDIVGGDIYWCRSWGKGTLLILGDCTGHGVPGAFMTLISNGALDEASLEVQPGNVAALLQRMHQLIQSSLDQDQEQDGKGSDDGIELGACFISDDNRTITFSGARFDLFVLEDGDVSLIKGVKSGLGYRGIARDVEFINHQINVTEHQTFYITTDGLIDQVGGERKRGFGKRRFKSLIISHADLSLADQKNKFRQALYDYQGDEKRRDDVSVIGFKCNPVIHDTIEKIEVEMNEDWFINFKAMDDDHKMLFGAIHRLETAVDGKEPKEIVVKIFDELVEYTEWHFRHEERLMQDNHFDGFEKHQKIHRSLARQVKRTQQDIMENKICISDDLYIFMWDWWYGHIQNVDKELAEFLNNLNQVETSQKDKHDLFVLDETLLVGFKEIDDDHKILVDLINKLHVSANGPFANAEVLKNLDELVEYTSWHFRHEERLMRAHNYPDMTSHMAQHEALILKATQTREQFINLDDNVLNDLNALLKNWLIHHIQNVDKKLANFLKTV